MAWSDALIPRSLTLAPHFVNDDHATAEITYSAALHIPEYSLGHGLVSPSWASPGKPWLLLCRGRIEAASRLCYGSVTVVLWVLLWQLPQPGENKHVCIPTAPPVFFSLLSGALTAWGSVNHVNSVNSKMTGVISRISNTVTILMCWLQIP